MSLIFWSPTGEKQVLKSKKIWIFLQICPEIALFSPKTSQKAPRDPLGPPRMTKTTFLGSQDIKTLE